MLKCTKRPKYNTIQYNTIQTLLQDLISKVLFFPQPTDAQVNCLKNNIKIYMKTAPTCFGVTVTPSSGSALV